MSNRFISLKTLILLCGDLLVLYGALISTLVFRYYPSDISLLATQHLQAFSFIYIIWIMLFASFGLYDIRFLKNERVFIYRLVRAVLFGFVIAILFFYLIPLFTIEPRRNLILITSFAVIFLLLWRHWFNVFISRAGAARVLFLGVNDETRAFVHFLRENPQLGQKPVACINGDEEDHTTIELPIFLIGALKTVIQEKNIETVVITGKAKQNKDIIKALFDVIPLGVGVIEFAAFHEALTGKVPLSLIHEVWFLENLIGKRKPTYEFNKRMLDIAIAIFVGGVFIFLFPFIALAIVSSSPNDILHYKQRRARKGDGIVFFRQPRVGKNGKIFNFIKFRSQRLGSERMGEIKSLLEDPRQYWFGKILRATYLDELPQIWNVLKGEMSFVGPRPERPEYVEKLKQRVPFYEMRLLAPPGITGWAQISMENDASVEDAPEKMQYDLYYIKNRSVALDLLIMLRTIFAIVQRQGR